MILYSITHGPRGYMLAKFDDSFNVAAVYNVNNRYCSCPAGPRPTCKHRKMLPRLLGKIDSGEFYCYETQTWHKPLGDLTRPEVKDLEGRGALSTANIDDSRAPDGLFLSTHAAIEEAIAGEAVGSKDKVQDELTAKDIEALSVGVEKDFHHAMQKALPSSSQPTMLIRRR